MGYRVVVTGVGVASPLGLDTESTWKALISGVSGVDIVSSFDPEPFECKIAAEVKGFEPEAYLSAKEVRRTDRFVQLAVAASLEAVKSASVTIDQGNAAQVGTIIGSGIGGIASLSQQFKVLQERGPSRVGPMLIPMMITDMASGYVSIVLGAKGPNFCVTSACSSGADSIGVAMQFIQRGEALVMLTGGAEAPICPISQAGFASMGALSKRNHDPKGASRPFDAQRDGFVIAEGAAILVLERMEHAMDRGAPILAELVGYGASGDAHHVTQPADAGEGGARAMQMALKNASLLPNDIDYISAHGTSTPLNDPLETMAIKTVFGPEAYRVPISSIKSMTGHLLGASGSLEAVVAVLAITNGEIPPTINLENPDPECDLDYVPWVARRGTVRAVLSNSMGFGGHNSCLVFRSFNGK